MSGAHGSEAAGRRFGAARIEPEPRRDIQPAPEVEASGDFAGRVLWRIVLALMAKAAEDRGA